MPVSQLNSLGQQTTAGADAEAAEVAAVQQSIPRLIRQAVAEEVTRGRMPQTTFEHLFPTHDSSGAPVCTCFSWTILRVCTHASGGAAVGACQLW